MYGEKQKKNSVHQKEMTGSTGKFDPIEYRNMIKN